MSKILIVMALLSAGVPGAWRVLGHKFKMLVQKINIAERAYSHSAIFGAGVHNGFD